MLHGRNTNPLCVADMQPKTRGAFVPDYSKEESVIEVEQRSITVFALRENKRPVGFAPWPKPKKKRSKKGGKR